MKRIRRLWVMKHHQRLCLTQSFYRDGKTHMCKDPADQRGEHPEQSAHATITNYSIYPGSPKTICSSSSEVIQASDSMGTFNTLSASRPPSKLFSINAPMP